MLFQLAASLRFITECLLAPCTIPGIWDIIFNENISLSLWNIYSSFGMKGRQKIEIKHNMKVSDIEWEKVKSIL